GDLFFSTSSVGGKLSTPVNVTNNAFRRTFAALQTGFASNVEVSKTFYPGPAAAAFDKDGHLLLLMIQNERGLFGGQVGLGSFGGSSTTPTMQFLRF
ncbi:MAG: hypothetical protein JWO31_2861, partial [Phycisphaerales bacterium]|nr:hypothetical protein [Phycisphaerales bacterium]